MNSAATTDPRVPRLLPLLAADLDVKADPRVAHALTVIEAWAAGGPFPGAHIRDMNRDGFIDRGNAVRIWDAWNDRLAADLVLSRIGNAAQYLGYGIADLPNDTGDAFFGGMWNNVLHILDPHSSLPPEHDWLGESAPRTVVTRALVEALDSLGAHSPAAIDGLRMKDVFVAFTALGAHPEIHIPWVNRGTWTHVAEITGRR
jgi:hypothetical protein